MIAFDTTIVNNELDNNDNSVIANDNVILSSPIQSQESEQKEDITENNTLPESSNLPVNEELGHNIPDTEGKPVNNNIVLSDDEIVDSESSTKTLPVDNENPYVKSFAVEVEAVTESKDTVNCDSKISTLKEALDNVILPELAKDKNMSHSAIAKLLEGKYLTSVAGKSTKWQGSLVKRALEYRKEYKV
ncbi:hypothetical protein GM3708_3620 (plasmid) [Geminocystis sp. NIES-3708]|nr:hypothetical protein GM3708_3620 [Geminocystis sp. NIES-3708]